MQGRILLHVGCLIYFQKLHFSKFRVGGDEVGYSNYGLMSKTGFVWIIWVSEDWSDVEVNCVVG